MADLATKYRPATFKDVYGQQDAVKVLTDLLKNRDRLPHAFLFSGPSGCGKTTLARILKKKLLCGDHDFHELNCADDRGIEVMRGIRSRMNMSPMNGEVIIWLIDEAHKLTNDAQNALLKPLEEPPDHVYFMLCTTDPDKLITTIRNRCHPVNLKGLNDKDLRELIGSITKQEKTKLTEDVVDKLVEVADGSARRALVLLNGIIGLNSEQEQLDAVLKGDIQRQAIEIARTLIKPGAKWSDMTPILKAVNEDPEQIRRMVLGYATTLMLSGNGKLWGRASLIITCFSEPFYNTGRAGLVNACYDVLQG
jgi:DNA polymerase III gamma/tau subunit